MRLLVILLLLAACTSSAPAPAPAPTPSPTPTPMKNTITDPSQRAALVDQEVTIIGIQTRTKIPQVNGVDVDGDYKLSDHKVIVRGILRQTVVTEVDPMTANRGTGTFYYVVDPATGVIAKPVLHAE